MVIILPLGRNPIRGLIPGSAGNQLASGGILVRDFLSRVTKLTAEDTEKARTQDAHR
jgi:hypothetical protein